MDVVFSEHPKQNKLQHNEMWNSQETHSVMHNCPIPFYLSYIVFILWLSEIKLAVSNVNFAGKNEGENRTHGNVTSLTWLTAGSFLWQAAKLPMSIIIVGVGQAEFDGEDP